MLVASVLNQDPSVRLELSGSLAQALEQLGALADSPARQQWLAALLMWCALDEHADPQACQVACDLLHAGYHELLPLLQAQEESIPVRSGSLFV